MCNNLTQKSSERGKDPYYSWCCFKARLLPRSLAQQLPVSILIPTEKINRYDCFQISKVLVPVSQCQEMTPNGR